MEQFNIAELEEKAEQEKQDKFVIDDDHKANWALKKIRQMKNKVAEKEEFAQKEIDEIKKWLEEETSKLEDSIEYFESMLTEYAMKMKEEDEDLKTHKLPAGKLQFRKRRPKWNYDNEKLMKHLEESGRDELIRVKKSPDKRKLKKQVEVAGNKVVDADTGEIIEGIEVQERGESFKVKVND